ncbi:MAG TPA: MFS transporter [Candidatus Omnitrophota bacterium]|nr:MFS transporter [Candidatus Omnitrophota bacterium]
MNTEQTPREKSLNTSLYKGVFGCCMTGLIQENFTPFLLHLGASAVHIGILNSASNFCASLIQLLSADINRKLGSRKKTVGFMLILQAVMLSAMTIFAYSRNPHYAIFIAIIVSFTAFGSLFQPAWVSLLSDLVNVNKRGEYFGWRQRVLGLLTVSSMGLGGIIIERMGRINMAYGFTIIFALALICRLVSFYFMSRMYEPPLSYRDEDQFSFYAFFKRIKESNFVKFVVFVASMNFAVNLAAPFFAVLMLRDLHFNYLLYTTIIIAAPLTLYLVVARWGRHADKVGSLKILRLTSRLIAIVPLLWVISRNPVYLVAVEMFSGFLWAGFNLCTINFIFDAASPEKRTRCLAYFSVVNGMALSAGAAIGGLLVTHLPALFGYQILALFVISSFARLTVAFILPRHVKEVRKTEHIKSADLFFSVLKVRPILGIDRTRIERM